MIRSIPPVLLLLAACAEAPAVPDEVVQAGASMDGAQDFSFGPTAFASQELHGRWIYDAPAGFSCSGTVDGWAHAPLFAAGAPGDLADFCVLTWVGVGSPILGKLPASSDLRVISPDRMAVVGMSHTPVVDLSVREDFEDNTYELVDPVSAYTRSLLPTRKSRVVLLDTVATSEAPFGESPNDEHGLRLAAIARRAVCDQRAMPACLARVETRLAMGFSAVPGTGFTTSTDGGSLGRQSDLATAIYDAVEDWDEDAHAPGSTVGRLVLNLSLSWHPETNPATARTATEDAVFKALQYASCQDALVLAAAGHDDTPIDESGGSGASLPAAWEANPEPSNGECNTLFSGVYSRSSRTTNYRPLVHAVSSVTSQHRRSAYARPGSLPKLLAPGEFLTMTPPGSSDPLDPITGTSAATVVASSAAAVAWALEPSASPHDIIVDHVYGAGQPYLDDDGNLVDAMVHVSGKVPQPARIVNVCKAALSAASTAVVPTTTVCDTAAVDPIDSASPPTTVDGSLGDSSSAECITGYGEYFYYGSSNWTGGYDCPSQELLGAAAVGTVLPMPPNMICPQCPVHLTAPPIAELHLAGDFSQIENEVITVHFEGATAEVRHYPLADMAVDVSSGSMAIVELPADALEHWDGGQRYDAISVTLDYTLAGQNYSYSDTLHLEGF